MSIDTAQIDLSKPEPIVQALFEMGFLEDKPTKLHGSLVNLLHRYATKYSSEELTQDYNKYKKDKLRLEK